MKSSSNSPYQFLVECIIVGIMSMVFPVLKLGMELIIIYDLFIQLIH